MITIKLLGLGPFYKKCGYSEKHRASEGFKFKGEPLRWEKLRMFISTGEKWMTCDVDKITDKMKS